MFIKENNKSYRGAIISTTCQEYVKVYKVTDFNDLRPIELNPTVTVRYGGLAAHDYILPYNTIGICMDSFDTPERFTGKVLYRNSKGRCVGADIECTKVHDKITLDSREVILNETLVKHIEDLCTQLVDKEE